ncbi:MAG: UDP-2,3-diacylglucosamine diphosphatase [Bacteroidales bacterium]|nr:UDP-2,3-diacylglucosamine diphosphatase [Bacteroidales bacterium]
MTGGKRYVFTSDTHLGAGGAAFVIASDEDGSTPYIAGSTEARFEEFLDTLPDDVKILFLLGDIFDFWFERPGVNHNAFTRILAAISRVVERGTLVYFFPGNHDWWTFGFLERQTGMRIIKRQPLYLSLEGKRFCMAHGDSIGPRGFGGWLLQVVLKNRLVIGLAKVLPASWLYRFASKWSGSSRHDNTVNPYVFDTRSPLYRFACKYEQQRPVDYFIFGHVHRKVAMTTPGGAQLFILNDWSEGADWLEFDSEEVVRK